MYPATIQQDRSAPYPRRDTVYRSYSVPNSTVDQVGDWYRMALSRAPWSVVSARRVAGSAQERYGIKECIVAGRDRGGGESRTYYFEVLGSRGSRTVDVNVGTPNPPSDLCKGQYDE